jgi:hypothetical protein
MSAHGSVAGVILALNCSAPALSLARVFTEGAGSVYGICRFRVDLLVERLDTTAPLMDIVWS